MIIDGQLVAETGGAVVTVGGFCVGIAKWLARRTDNRIAKLEKERAASEQALRDNAAASEERCRRENADLTSRIRELEARSHGEAREDRKQLLEIVSQGAEANRQSAQATLQVGRALERLAEYLPEKTPPGGTRTT